MCVFSFRQRQAEADKEELQDLKEACLFPQSDGVTFAAERLEAAQADVKEQFKVVFAELKEALEVNWGQLIYDTRFVKPVLHRSVCSTI